MITMSADTTATRSLLARSPTALTLALRATYNDASALFLRELATYPPAPPRSTYKRTRTLGRAWSRQFSGAGLGLSVLIGNNGNMAPYNRRVQDRDRQARVHRTRWTNTVQGVAERNERNLTTMLERRVNAYTAQLGG
jgi:hypothetical protein